MDGRKKPWEAGKCRKTRRKTKKYAAAVLVHDPSPSLFDTLFPEREQVDNYERERQSGRCLLQLMSGDFMTLFSHSGRSSKQRRRPSPPPSSSCGRFC